LTALSYLFDYQYITEARWIKTWIFNNFGHNACLVPNGLDSDIFHPCPPLVPKGNKPRILLEGAIGLPFKGMKEAFEAVAPLDVEVWCVSSLGKPESNWKCDRFFEQVPMTEMKKIYSSCDILLKLSRVEGFFGPPMEMMACGGVVVVGRVTGYDEYIVDGYNAIVIDPLDVTSATDAVQNLISNKTIYDNLVENGKKTAHEWAWETSIDTLESHYAVSLELKEAPLAPALKSIDINKSLSFLYYTFLGEINSDNAPVAKMVSDNNAERLCRLLKHNRLFRLLANTLAAVYQFINHHHSSR
jgi:glycosyltransferase involved in cell wall biosynthesis